MTELSCWIGVSFHELLRGWKNVGSITIQQNKNHPHLSMTKIPLIRFLILTTIAAGIGMTAASAADDQAALAAKAKVSKEKATTIAMQKVPGGSIKSTEIEKEDGMTVWSFDINTTNSKNITEVQVDANTGKVVSVEQETPKAQKKEDAADAKEGK